MKGRILKSTVVQMIGFIMTWAAFSGYQPIAIGYFIALWCSRLIRFPMFPIMTVGFFINSGFLSGAKYSLVLFTIMIVLYILEGKKSRVPIMTGAFLGGGVLYAMELTDYFMAPGHSRQLLLATASTILAVSLSILFYKIMELFQMPRDRENRRQEKDGYKEKLNSYEERMNSISDAFAFMAKSVEKASEDDGINKEENEDICDSQYCSRCKALKRQNDIYKSKLMDSRRVIATQLSEMSKILGECLKRHYEGKKGIFSRKDERGRTCS